MFTHLSASYVLLKEMKPSEDYLTPYLVKDKNFTEQQTYQDIFPVWTYSSAVLTCFAFLFTDQLGYKHVVILEAMAYLATRILLVWGTELFEMQAMQGIYALATSTELGYSVACICSTHWPTSHQLTLTLACCHGCAPSPPIQLPGVCVCSITALQLSAHH